MQSVTPIYDSSGKLTHYVGIQSDITQLINQKKAELAAKHAAMQVDDGVPACRGQGSQGQPQGQVCTHWQLSEG
jgi:hypothetical protein